MTLSLTEASQPQPLGLKAVIFDLGDVLLRTVDDSRRTAWERRLGLAPGEVEHIVFGGENGWAVQLGQVTDAEHWRSLQDRLGLDDAGLARFREDFFAGDQLDHDLLAYIGRLRLRYHIGLLSNASNGVRRLLTEKHGIIGCFDSVTISAEEGVMKPDPRIYRIALARAGAAPAEAIFVDDSLRNVEGARAIGMTALHYTDPPACRQRLVALTGVADD
jgi:putative hydrolase of the HAD superfamily